jgi:hypothetical protein
MIDARVTTFLAPALASAAPLAASGLTGTAGFALPAIAASTLAGFAACPPWRHRHHRFGLDSDRWRRFDGTTAPRPP